MRLLVKNVRLDEAFELDTCDFLLVDLDALRDELLKLKERVAPLFDVPGFYAASFYHFGFDIVELATVAEADWFNEEADVQQVPDGVVIPPSDTFRVVSPTIRIKPEGFLWHFYEKHSDARIESLELQWNRLGNNTIEQVRSPENC